MAKFCVYCGAPLEQGSNLCPLCEREQPNLSVPKPMVWPSVKQEEVPKETQPQPEEQQQTQPLIYSMRWLKETALADLEEKQEEKQSGAVPEPLEEDSQKASSEENAPDRQEADVDEVKNKALISVPALEDFAVEQDASRAQKETESKTVSPEPTQAEDQENTTKQEPLPETQEQQEVQTEEAPAPLQPMNEPERLTDDKADNGKDEQQKQEPEMPAASLNETGEAEKQQEYEETFSELLQDFSKEQEHEAKPPEPKYIPMATYEEQPELTTAGILGMLVLAVLPVLGWIIMLVWAFDGQARPFQKRLARAILLFKLLLWLVFAVGAVLVGYLSYQLIEMSAFSAFMG